MLNSSILHLNDQITAVFFMRGDSFPSNQNEIIYELSGLIIDEDFDLFRAGHLKQLLE